MDLEQRTAELVPELGWMAGAASSFELDGHSPAFDVRGWSFQFQKLR